MARDSRYNLTGQRFGKLKVISRVITKKKGRVFWNCICDCGNEKCVRGDDLKSGRTRSCGSCRRKENKKINMVQVSIQEVCDTAQREGISFGEYVAMQYVLCTTGRRNSGESSGNRKGNRKIQQVY